MKKALLLSILFIMLAAGCDAIPEVLHVDESGAVVQQLSDLTIDPPGLVQDNTDLVSGSGNCAECHTGLKAAANACQGCHEDLVGDFSDISFDTLWRASMMAHSAKDPYWQASVSTETAEFPELTQEIAERCSRCHMPLAHFDAIANGETPLILGQGFLDLAHELHDLAMDGVSCNLCHQIQRDGFGEPGSFSGQYVIDSERRDFGDRVSFGPLPITEGYAKLMQLAIGYKPIPSGHSDDAELCGTCHNLYTPYLNNAGEIVGEFPEQTVHLEWVNSSYADETCMDCHMPLVQDTPVSSLSTDSQSYMRLHTFTGANAFMLNLLQENAEEIGITAEQTHMDGAIGRVESQLAFDANKEIRMGDVFSRDNTMTVEISLSNDNGHKRPTGFPSRRIWIHFKAMDANGEVFFESGAWDDNGYIQGNDNDIDPALYEPHYQVIDSPEQVQIYEAIMHNTENEVTTTLLRAAGYLKDNRLLPAGFPVDDPPEDIAPRGTVEQDEDFLPRTDMINYVLDTNGHPGPYTIEVELLYQSIGYRWAENLRKYSTPERDQFFHYFDAADRTPILVGVTRFTGE
jgi:hypothetical protein